MMKKLYRVTLIVEVNSRNHFAYAETPEEYEEKLREMASGNLELADCYGGLVAGDVIEVEKVEEVEASDRSDVKQDALAFVKALSAAMALSMMDKVFDKALRKKEEGDG